MVPASVAQMKSGDFVNLRSRTQVPPLAPW